MREVALVDLVQTVGIVVAFLFVAYLIVVFRNDQKTARDALEKLLKGQQRLHERLEGIETLQGIHSDVADIAQIRRVAAALRVALDGNDNETPAPREGNGGGR